MKALPLKARVRTEAERGTRACRRMRSEGEVPANLFKKGESIGLAVSAYDITQLLNKNARLLDVNFDGREELVQVTEVQRDVFGDDVLHIDLHMIPPDKPIHVKIPIALKGEAKGTKLGGKMIKVMKSIEVEALPRAIPDQILVRIDDLDVGQGLHVNELTYPENVRPYGDPRALVVQVVAQVEEVEEGEGEGLELEGSSSEPEVIAKGKKDEE